MRPDPDEFGPDGRGLGRVVGVLSAMTGDDTARFDPPSDLWHGIAATLPAAEETALPARPELGIIDDEHLATGGNGAERDAVVVRLEHRRRRLRTRVAAAAAVIVLAVGTFGVVASNRHDTRRELVASVTFDVLADSVSGGSAELVRVGDEQRLIVETDAMTPAPDGTHYELWLIDTEVTDPRALGELPPDAGEVEVTVPRDIDPTDFPIVDINLQRDSDVVHSGLDTSVLRGSLA